MSVLDLLSSSPVLFIGACLALGLLVGSFLNVVIYRVPIMLEHQWREQCAELAAASTSSATPRAALPMPASPEPRPAPRFNLVVPRSSCPSCKAPITAMQNIPVLSYLLLKGRCASCGRAPGVGRDPAISLSGVAILIGWMGSTPLTAAGAWRIPIS